MIAGIPWLAWPAALVVGLSLGVLGSGGSILTVPLLHLLVGLRTPVAVATSLPIVGIVALVGMAGYARAGDVRWRAVGPFVLTSVPTAFAAHALLFPEIPVVVQTFSFAALMLVVAFRMAVTGETPAAGRHPALVLLAAVVVGVLNGCLGVGGGFVIVPALVLMLGFEPKAAVATSLLVIAMNCGASLLADQVGKGATVRWDLAAVFGAVGAAGALLGGRIARGLPPVVIRRTFAAVVVVLAVAMIVGAV